MPNSKINPRAFLLLLLLIAPRAAVCDDAAPNPDNRLRDALRNTMLQLRDAQNQVATLQAAQADSDKAKADLQTKADALDGQVAALTKQSSDDKAAADKTAADLQAQLKAQTDQVAKLNTALEQWKTAYNQQADLAKKTETARQDLAIKGATLQRLVEDRERKNLELFRTGSEILDRYEKFSLGDALEAKEPFVGITRVKLQEQVQDYQDKLVDGKVSMGQASPASTPLKPAAPERVGSTAP